MHIYALDSPGAGVREVVSHHTWGTGTDLRSSATSQALLTAQPPLWPHSPPFWKPPLPVCMFCRAGYSILGLV